jgi:hypothetical protein
MTAPAVKPELTEIDQAATSANSPLDRWGYPEIPGRKFGPPRPIISRRQDKIVPVLRLLLRRLQ